jgi:hypothetical protein
VMGIKKKVAAMAVAASTMAGLGLAVTATPAAAAAQPEAGYFTVFTDRDFNGLADHFIRSDLNAGIRNLADPKFSVNLNDSISSLYDQIGGLNVCLSTNANYGGSTYKVFSFWNVYYVGNSWNDKFSSIKAC